MRNFASRVIRAVRLLPVAFHRWGLIGTCERIWSIWRSGGRSALVQKLRDTAAMEAALRRSSAATESQTELHSARRFGQKESRSAQLSDPAIFIELESDFGVDCTRWNVFLSRRAPMSVDEKGIGPATWFLVNNDKGSSGVRTTLRPMSWRVCSDIPLPERASWMIGTVEAL